MSARFPQYRAVLVVAALLVAAVAPWAGPAEVATAASSGSFQENVVQEPRGDVMNITVETDAPGTVNLGSPEVGFWMQVTVGEGTTNLRLNTYKAGRAGIPLNEMVWATEGDIRDRSLETARLSGPLEESRYPMNVTVNGVEQDIGAFVVQERATNDISARLAPRDTDVQSLTPGNVTDATTALDENGTVARGDWLVLHVEATGLDGLLSKRILDGNKHGVAVDFEQSTRGMNVDPNHFDGSSVEHLVSTPDRDGFYLFVDTANHDIEAGDGYDVTFSVAADSPLAAKREAVSTTVQIVERRVTLQYDGTELVVDGKTTIRATTTLAPGTTVNVTARDEELPPFRKDEMPTVGGDRSFAVTFDFGDLEPGREFEVRLRDQGQRHDAVVAGGTTTAPETTETPDQTETTADPTTETKTSDPTTADPTTDAPTDSTTEPGSNETTTPAETTAEGLTQATGPGEAGPLTQRTIAESSGGLPGFDVGLAVVALLAAGLLAVRRS